MPVQEGVRLYSDLVRVRVCESRGRVVGMDALMYRLNHHERKIGTPREEAVIAEYLSPRLKVEAAHLALVPFGREERLCYAFECTFGEEQYLAFLDAGERGRARALHARARRRRRLPALKRGKEGRRPAQTAGAAPQNVRRAQSP